MFDQRDQSGQAAVDLVATIPALVLLTLIAFQLALAGYGLWSAALEARTEARAAHVSGAPGATSVAVRVPGVLPGVDGLRVQARAWLGGFPEAGRGG
jgi:hypothetical protein